MAELADVWKLKDYILKSAQQWWRVLWATMSEQAPYKMADDIIKGLKVLTPDKPLSTPGEIQDYQTKTLNDIMLGFQQAQIPSILAVPVNMAVLIAAMIKTVSANQDILLEKNVLQGLREKIRPLILEVPDLMKAELLGALSKPEVTKELGKHGYSDRDIAVLRRLTQYAAGPQDIIQFAVREAYDPATVQTFGMDQNLDKTLEATAEDRAKVGLSDELFAKFWTSHWELPSVNQGFEALQRGLIDKSKLEMLLTAKDVMPYWRDVLLGLSYNLLTRVDVRRMHKLGIMTREQVKAEYQRMGHSPEDAEKLTLFTEAYNKDPESGEDTEEDRKKRQAKDLTKSDILGAFKDGVITRADAEAQLRDLKYSVEETAFLIGRTQNQITMEFVDKYITAVGKLYKSGGGTWKEAEAALLAIPLTPEKVNQLHNIWDLELDAQTELPSKAEVLRFLKKGIIKKAEAEGLLSELGVQRQYIDWYIKDAE